jgi:membrane protein implicated in regulation of membrane protease activity
MKTLTSEVLAISAWGLHLTSFMVASIPYLQVASLVLAIVVSILTIRKLVKNSNQKAKNSNDKIY